MFERDHNDLGITLLRLTNGLFLLTHGVMKLVYFPPKGTMRFFEGWGLPGALGYGVMIAEIIFGLALLVGYQTRKAAIGASIILLGAILPHAGNGFTFSNPGGGWEYPAFWAICLIALALLARKPTLSRM